MIDMYKKQKIAGMIIVTIFLILFLSLQLSQNDKHGISAKEGKEIADSIAKNWHNDSVFVYCGSMGSCKDGLAEEWYYVYYSPSTKVVEYNITKYEQSFIYVNANGYTKIDSGFAVDSAIGLPARNWVLDSTDVAQIAKDNPTISAYLSKYKNPSAGYTLQVIESYPNRTTWSIGWIDWGVMDDPHSARIYIDATTGEVLYVEADLSDGSSYLICFVPVVIIISILLVISLSKSKRFPNFFTATGFALFLIPTLYLRIYYSTSIFTFMTLVFAAVLWLGTKRRMSSTDLNMEHQQVYGLFGLLAADYFGLLIARFLLIPYSYPNLLWSSLLIINGVVLYILLSPSEGEGTGELLKPFKN